MEVPPLFGQFFQERLNAKGEVSRPLLSTIDDCLKALRKSDKPVEPISGRLVPFEDVF